MVEIFLERAEQLSSARNLIQDDPPYAAATALLSVHTAIALNDALLLKLGAKSLKNEDHMASVRETVKRCKAKGIDSPGVTQLRKLVSASRRYPMVINRSPSTSLRRSHSRLRDLKHGFIGAFRS